MTSRDLVPRDEIVVGTESEIETILRTSAMRGRLLTRPEVIRPREIGPGRYAVKVRMLLPPTKLPLRTRLRKWDRAHPVTSALLKAMAFVLTTFALIVGAVFAVIAMARHALAGVDAKPIIGGFLFAMGALFFLINRLNHSGACPGIAAHCSGCKH